MVNKTSADEKVRENRLRRVAARQGFTLLKSRRRDPKALDYAGYSILDPAKGAVIIGANKLPFSSTLDEIEEWLETVPRIVKYATQPDK